jgi:cytochrome c556
LTPARVQLATVEDLVQHHALAPQALQESDEESTRFNPAAWARNAHYRAEELKLASHHDMRAITMGSTCEP